MTIERDELDLLRTSLSADQEELNRVRTSLERERESLDAERSALAADRERVSEVESNVHAQSRELEAAKNVFEVDRSALEKRGKEIKREQADLDCERDQIEQERAQLKTAWEVFQAEQAALIAARESAAKKQQAKADFLAAPKPVEADRADQLESDTINNELQKIQGTWTLISVEADGWEVPSAVIKRKKVVWVIKGDTIMHRPDIGLKRESTFELDLTKTPNEIDFRPLVGKSKRAIYSLGNDYLRVCVNKDKDQLPTAFSTRARDGVRILVFKRHLR